PSVDYAVLFEIGDAPPPPSAAPPPRPQASAAATEDARDDVDTDDDRDVPLEDDLDLAPVKPKAASVGEHTRPGVPHGVGPGVPGATCLVPPCVGKDPIGSSFVPGLHRPAVSRPEADDRVVERIAVVKENAVYSPDPDDKKLA